jgi:hypothetical protein
LLATRVEIIIFIDGYIIMGNQSSIISSASSTEDAGTSEKLPPFEKFIELIGRKSVGHWVQIAKALNVSPDTITDWKKHPLAKKTIRDEIDRAMDGMEDAGFSDWRMWESKLKMLGISPIEKADVTSNGETVNIGVISYDDVVKKNK